MSKAKPTKTEAKELAEGELKHAAYEYAEWPSAENLDALIRAANAYRDAAKKGPSR